MRFVLLLGVMVVGCAAKSQPAPDSTLQGSAALTSFPSAPNALVVRDETGRVTTTPLAADGSFSTTLARGHTYRVSFATATGEVPLIYPRQTGKLDAAFMVRSNGARVQLGAVRRMPSAPLGGFKAVSSAAPSGAGHEDEVDDDQKVSCGDGHDGADDAESADSGEQADASRELAVGERNAPQHVDGCDSGENEGKDD